VRLALTVQPESLTGAAATAAARLDPAAVRFLGYVPDLDLPALLAGAQAFVFASRSEGFGLPPLEAMASGAAVISARSGGLAEIVGDAGLLLEPDDVAAWAQAMARAWTDTAWRDALAARGRARAASFTWARTAESTLAVYRSALGRAQRAPR
jgi:glycosyltransferase involved in cell wall biosynthesis